MGELQRVRPGERALSPRASTLHATLPSSSHAQHTAGVQVAI